MTDVSIARRYAHALLDLAREQGLAEQVGREIADFGEALGREDLVREVLMNPGFSKDERKALLGGVLAHSGYAEVTRNFLMLLVDKSRIDGWAEIGRAYEAELDGLLGRVRATVRSATPLDAATVGRLRDHLAGVTGKQVVLTAEVDPSLIGGLVTQVGSLVFDGSLRTRLDAIKTRLLRDQMATA